MRADYNDYKACIRKEKNVFQAVLYDKNFKMIENIAARSRVIAYLSIYKLVLKHSGSLSLYEKFYLTMRLIGYYFYLVF